MYTPSKLLLSRQKRLGALSVDGHVCDNTIIVAVPYFEFKGLVNSHLNEYFKNIKIDRKILQENSMKFDIRCLLGIINSKLISYFLQFNSSSKIDTYLDDWKKYPLKPLMKINKNL